MWSCSWLDNCTAYYWGPFNSVQLPAIPTEQDYTCFGRSFYTIVNVVCCTTFGWQVTQFLNWVYWYHQISCRGLEGSPVQSPEVLYLFTTAHVSVNQRSCVHYSSLFCSSPHVTISSPELTCLLTTTPCLSIRAFVFVHNNALVCSLTCLFITAHFSVHYSLPVCSPQIVWLFTTADLSLEHYACFCSTELVSSPQFTCTPDTARARGVCVCVCVFTRRGSCGNFCAFISRQS
jgi:hypothetical protein